MKKFILATLFIVFVSLPLSTFAQQAGTSGGNLPSDNLPTFNYSTGGAPSGNFNITPISNITSGSRAVGCGNLTTGGLRGVVACVIEIFNYAVILMVAGAVVLVVWGAFQMITSEEKRASGRQTIIYGVIGIFVMVSVWGLVSILQSTFSLDAGPIDPPRLTK